MDKCPKPNTYRTYKESGVDWLGKIPTNWSVKKLKHLTNCTNSGVWGENPGVLPIDAHVIRTADITMDGKLKCGAPLRSVSRKDFCRYRLAENDIVVVKSSGSMANVISGKCAIVQKEENYLFSNFIMKLSPKASVVNPQLVFYYLISPIAREQINLMVEGSTYPNLRVQEYLNFLLPLPCREEQDRIANYLDQKTTEIDEAITKKQRLIELLKEQKATLINQAVTKGLNPDAPMGDSGVEWIGEVPAHWGVKRAKYLFKVIDERSQMGNEELLSVSHLTGVTPRSEKNVYMFKAEDYSGSKLCKKDDLVFNIMWAWMGALGVSDRTGIVSPSYGVYRQQFSGTFNPWYLENLLKSERYVAEYNRRSTGLNSSRLRLYPDMFFDMQIVLPSRKEQDEIEKKTTDKAGQIDKAVLSVKAEMEKLKEFREVLISQSVTGKIKL